MFLCRVPLHHQQQNVQSSSEVLTTLVPDHPDQVVEDGLHDGGPMEVPLPRHKDLLCPAVSGDDQCWDLVSTAGVMVSLVKTKELERVINSKK